MPFLLVLLAHFTSQGYDMTLAREEAFSSLTIQFPS